MANTKKNKQFDESSSKARLVFQNLLKDRVKTKSDIEVLANVLGKTTSLVKKMIYKGEGGLDVWMKALAHVYQDGEIMSLLKEDVRRRKPNKSDQIWFSIRDEYEVSEDDMLYLALCAKEAIRIKHDLVSLKKKRGK